VGALAEPRTRAHGAVAEPASERAHADELARTVEILTQQAEDLARQSAEEATAARTRLMDTQDALAKFQQRLEGVGSEVDPAAEVAIARDAAGEVIDAISMDAKRSISTIFGLARAMGAAPEVDQTRLVQQLMTQLKRMEHAVGDLIEADQLARGEVQLHRRSTEIDTLLRRVVRDFPHPEDRRIDVAVETATIQVDPARLERLVDDLLSTAVGRTSAGDRIVLRMNRVEGGVVIAVEDGKPDGTVGAAAEFLAKLHGGWTAVEALPDGSSAVRAFLPTVWTPSAEPSTPVGGSDDLETAPTEGFASSGDSGETELMRRLSSRR
jgi:signal transduction histidine kinase